MGSRAAALLTRHRRNVGLLARFGVVGASGVLVNLLTLVVLRRLGPHFDDAVVAIGSSGFNLRWYHVYSTIAFLVANLSNFQLNRTWTFKSSGAAPWWREYWPFFVVGVGCQVVGLALLTLLMHPHSPIGLSRELLDDSSGLRNRLYWAQLIVITLVTPLSFVVNKLWTFAAVRTARVDLGEPRRADDVRTR
ncbi:GtrA family protein [Nocardioides sp. zg-1228]|uniref:GtrA family protein n=1 Tax=Nocardioides sp. zg-1228 TaxID=2763008 RepID=UPI0016432658|nr:GtrA family protein [Nocardioides sp. zg-1228]MBC2934113.1 GtrA family protein [Nocardioides sp. zg-1228]QSF58861.1 GtrA family protein [Nocardioides sp. zg-1228]